MVKVINKPPKKRVSKKPFIGINVRCTMKQKAELMAKAAQCGMTEGEYVRACCIGHEPRVRLTAYEAMLLDNLSACRADMVNFANALKMLSESEKTALFHTQSKMLTWLKSVNIVAMACKEFIDEVTKTERI